MYVCGFGEIPDKTEKEACTLATIHISFFSVSRGIESSMNDVLFADLAFMYVHFRNEHEPIATDRSVSISTDQMAYIPVIRVS